MNFHYSIFIFTVFALALSSESLADTKILREKDCTSGIYASYKSFTSISHDGNLLSEKQQQYNRSRISESAFNNFKENYICKVFVYPSDQYNVGAFHIYKKNTAIGKKPILLFNRGGNGRYGEIRIFELLEQLKPLADLGVHVFATQYRGGMALVDGPAEDVDEFGGADVHDVIHLAEVAVKSADVDRENVHLVGVSRGGINALRAAYTIDNVKSVTIIGAPTDLNALIRERPEMEEILRVRIPNYEKNKEAEIKNRSALFLLNDSDKRIPLLILHGNLDKRVSVEQSVLLSRQLKQLNYPHKLVIYDDFHELSHSQLSVYKEIKNWVSMRNKSGAQ